MSRESWESDNNSSKEDIELTELNRRPGSYSDSCSSADLTTSCGKSITLAETSEDEAFYSAVSILNSSDENHLAFDSCRTSSRSLEGVSTVSLTRKTSYLEEPSIKPVSLQDHLEPSTRKVSSLDSLEKPSFRRVSSLGGLTTKRSLSHERLSIRKVLSLERLSSKKNWVCDSSQDFLEDSSTGKVTFQIPLGGHLNRNVSTLEGPLYIGGSSLEEPLVRRVSSLEEPLVRRVSSLEEPLTRRVSSLEVLSVRRVASLDPLERPSTGRVGSLDPLEGPSTRRVASLDPLEGPSTRTDFLSSSAESSLSSVLQPNLSDSETIEYVYNEPPAEHSGYILSWLNNFLRRQSRQIRHSVYYPLFLVALLAIPFSAGYMGCTHFYLCSGCPKLPYLIYFLGLLGLLLLFLQLTSVLSRRYFSPHLDGNEFNTWMVSLCVPFFIVLILEMFTVYICEPVFIPPHKEFCAKVFYNYAYYGNITVPIIIILLMVIIIPGHYDPSEAE